MALVIAAAIGGWAWWSRHEETAGTAPPTTAPPVTTASAPPAAHASAVKYPLPPREDLQPVDAQGIPAALAELLGRKAVENFLHTDDFARRFVATVDNLGREHAPAAMWPVTTTPERFLVEQRAGDAVISPDNAARYTPLVLVAETVDAATAVRLYRRMYPLLQASYRELGFGDRYLNDRVVEVIDLLLASPEPEQPPQVQLTEVKGPVPSRRPWVRYEFVDPRLEGLPAGQKILVRIGPAHERRLKKKLRELREELVAAPQPASAAR